MDCTLASWCMIDHLLKLCRQEGCKFCISSLASDGEREKFLLSLPVFWSVWCSPHPREFLVPARRTQRPAQRPQCAERNWYKIAKANNETKGIYNRLPLIMSYLLDIDLALWSLLLPWEVKFNKSWNTFFQ